MEQLEQRHFRSLLSFVQGAYGTRSLDEFGSYVIRHLSVLVSSEWTSYDEMIPSRRISRNLFDPPDILPPDAWAALMHQHPMLANYLKTRDGSPRQIADFMTPSQFKKTALYNEVYRGTGVDQEVVIALDVPLPSVVGFGLGRAGRPFDGRERLLLDLVRPHLHQAYNNASTLSELQNQRRQMISMLLAQRCGVVRLDSTYRVVESDDGVRELLSAYFESRRESDGGLPDALDRWTRAQAAALASRPDDAPLPIRPLVVERPGWRLCVRFVPGAPDSLLILEEQPVVSPSNATSNLTVREIEVLKCARHDETNAEIAESLGIAEGTVKKHLDNIYAKLGVRSRAGAIGKVWPDNPL